MASPSSEDDIGSKMASNGEGNSDERQQGGQKRGHITMERMEGQSGQAKREETVAKLQYNEKLKRERKKKRHNDRYSVVQSIGISPEKTLNIEPLGRKRLVGEN